MPVQNLLKMGQKRLGILLRVRCAGLRSQKFNSNAWIRPRCAFQNTEAFRSLRKLIYCTEGTIFLHAGEGNLGLLAQEEGRQLHSMLQSSVDEFNALGKQPAVPSTYRLGQLTGVHCPVWGYSPPALHRGSVATHHPGNLIPAAWLGRGDQPQAARSERAGHGSSSASELACQREIKLKIYTEEVK